MTHYLKYGKSAIKLRISGGKLLGVLKAKEYAPGQSESNIVVKAIGNKVENFVTKNDRVAVVVPDNTRVSGTRIYLPILLRRLLRLGIPKRNIIIFVATGSHKPLNKKDIDVLIGSRTRKEFRTVCNDAFKRNQFYFAGKTKRGTPIRINKELKKVDKIIAVSGVLYHYFAGYGGGPKILMPGLAGFESIAANHKLTLMKNGEFNPNCTNGNVKDNPVYLDITDSMKFFPPVLYLGTILNEEGKIVNAFCGDIVKEHIRAAKFLDRIYKIKIKKRADVVICSPGGYPKDINLIQSHKSIHNAYAAVKKTGTIVCFAECTEGVGSKTFLKFFGYKDIDTLRKNILENYSLNAQTALAFWRKLLNTDIIIVSRLREKEIKPITDRGLMISGTKEIASYLSAFPSFNYYLIPSSNSLLITSHN